MIEETIATDMVTMYVDLRLEYCFLYTIYNLIICNDLIKAATGSAVTLLWRHLKFLDGLTFRKKLLEHHSDR